MKGGPGWNRLAAATGIVFAAALIVNGIIGEVNDIAFPGDYATASNELYGTVSLLDGIAALCLFWFSGTLAARIRQLEGGSGRLAAVVNNSGAVLAGTLALGIAGTFAARNGGAPELAALTTALFNGPSLFFPAAAYVGAAGIAGVRAEGLPSYSRFLAQLSIPLAATFVALAGLQIFKYYAWINETGVICFVVWVLLLSIIGVQRWGEMDERTTPIAPVAPSRAAPPPRAPDDAGGPPAPRPRKPQARKTTARKAKPKAPARKP